jgi:hypothetical protein
MQLGVRIGEQAALEHFVWGRLNPWDHPGGRKCRLLDLLKVVLRIAVEGDHAHGDQRELVLGPNFGHIKWIPTMDGGLGEGHNLKRKGMAFLINLLIN